MRFNAEFAAYLLSRTDLDILVVPLLQMLCVRFFSAHCTALHCTALHCIALHCTALHCTALHCTALHCNSLRHTHCCATSDADCAGRMAQHGTAQRVFRSQVQRRTSEVLTSLRSFLVLSHRAFCSIDRSQSALCTVHSERLSRPCFSLGTVLSERHCPQQHKGKAAGRTGLFISGLHAPHTAADLLRRCAGAKTDMRLPRTYHVCAHMLGI
jgi:hypothetical protein